MNDADQTTGLHKAMGFLDVVLLLVITTFGIMAAAKAAEAGAAGITMWLLGGVTFYLPLAVAVIVLASRYPGEGGLYLWSEKSFGRFAGFMTGWMYWTCILPFLPLVLYFVACAVLFIGPADWQAYCKDPYYCVFASLVGLAVVTALNVFGLGVTKWLHNAGALGTWLPALVLIGLAFAGWFTHGSATSLAAEEFVPVLSRKNLVLWPLLIMSLTGLEAASILGSEIKDSRTLPAALIFAAVLVIITEIVGTLAVLVAMPAEALEGPQGFIKAIEQASVRAGVGGVLPLAAGLAAIGHLGKVSAWSAAGARLPMMAGAENVLPEAFGRIHPRWGTPYVALLFQSAIVAVLVVIGQAGTSTEGAYNVFFSMTLIPTFIPFLLVFASAFKTLWRAGAVERRRNSVARGLCLLSIGLGFVTTVVSVVLAVLPPEDEADKALYVAKVVGLAALLVIGGVVIYVFGHMAKRQT